MSKGETQYYFTCKIIGWTPVTAVATGLGPCIYKIYSKL